jgi:hypothetical protein
VSAIRSSVAARRRWASMAAALVIVAAFGGYGLARATTYPPRDNSSLPEVSRVVTASGVSDCHRLDGRQSLVLSAYTWGLTAAVPVVIDNERHVWGPRCVIAAGVVHPGSLDAATEPFEWSPPGWDMSRSSPGTAQLLDLPGLSECRPGDRPTGSWWGAEAGLFVVVADRHGRLWGPRCVVSSGVAAS